LPAMGSPAAALAHWEPRVPVDLPPFLAAMLASQARAVTESKCQCVATHKGSGRYLFTGPDGGHHRRSDYARRVFRPAADGRYLPKGKPGKLVIVDAAMWPGLPVAAWPEAIPGPSFEPPTGRGTPRPVNASDTGRCPGCGRSQIPPNSGPSTAEQVA
jgi:hypothetical protein